MASNSLSISSLPSPLINSRMSRPFLPLFLFSPHLLLRTRPPKIQSLNFSASAYVSGPASDYVVTEPDPNVDGFRSENSEAINWGLLWTLLMEHKLGLALCAASLVGCTSCTLSMPLFSGRFFEVLSGARSEPLWKLMSRIAVVYSMEPIFTVIFVVNMNKIWEKVMSVLRAQIFKRMLIQKVEFFDRYKVGELTGLVTTDLGSVKNSE